MIKPIVEKAFLSNAPILSPSLSRYESLDKLPGKEFSPQLGVRKSIAVDPAGQMYFSPGDYIIPVMTYCMHASGSSPRGHIYSLSEMRGARAKIISVLNQRAWPKYYGHDLQILSWSLQQGLSFEEMTSHSQQIVNEIIPEYKDELKESFLKKIERDWDLLAEKSLGQIPLFKNVSNDLLDQLGEVGQEIKKIRHFKQRIFEAQDDYDRLSDIISVPETLEKNKPETTKWNKISDRIFARFITSGRYQEVGQIQVRVLPSTQSLQKRNTSSLETEKLFFDLTSLMADPGGTAVQPLSFVALFGSTGSLIVSEAIVTEPLVLAALLGAILATEVVDWDAFFKLTESLKDNNNQQIQNLIKEGNKYYSEVQDQLEKPARDAKILDENTKNTTGREKNPTRQYDKPGGEKALNQDFDKIDGVPSKTSDGKDMKTLPDGTRVVRRPITEKDKTPTLEFQPPKTGSKIEDKQRIKIRYK